MQSIVHSTARVLKRRGVVVGVSGGIDSSVCLALAVGALGPNRVVALLMPEWESDDGSTDRGRELCEAFGVVGVEEHIGPILEAAGCYRRRDDAIREVFPDFGDGMAPEGHDRGRPAGERPGELLQSDGRIARG